MGVKLRKKSGGWRVERTQWAEAVGILRVNLFKPQPITEFRFALLLLPLNSVQSATLADLRIGGSSFSGKRRSGDRPGVELQSGDCTQHHLLIGVSNCQNK